MTLSVLIAMAYFLCVPFERDTKLLFCSEVCFAGLHTEIKHFFSVQKILTLGQIPSFYPEITKNLVFKNLNFVKNENLEM